MATSSVIEYNRVIKKLSDSASKSFHAESTKARRVLDILTVICDDVGPLTI